MHTRAFVHCWIIAALTVVPAWPDTGRGAPVEDSRVPASSRVTIYPAPAGEPASQDYAVTVNGRPVFCYTSYRFDADSAATLAGRPVSPVSFCAFDLSGEAEVTVRLLDGLDRAGIDTSRVTVRPLAHGVRPDVVDGAFSFRVSRPCQLTVEAGEGLAHPLHIFVNPLETDAPDPNDPRVRYFGPGVHDLGETDIGDAETVYIAGGAIVNLRPVDPGMLGESHRAYGVEVWWAPGLFSSKWRKQVTIRGRGILCGRKALERGQRGHLIRVQGIDGLEIEGIIIRESSVWSLNVVNSNRVHIDNVKVIGHYVNNDGIVIGGTSDALVENCFSHNADDSFEVKVWIPQRNVVFRNCVVWTDVGGSLGLCCECGADLTNVLYQDCTVLHATCASTSRGAIGIELEGEGTVSDFRFERVTIEDVRGALHAPIKVVNNWDDWHMGLPHKPGRPYQQLNPPVRDKPRGAIRDVLFRDVRVLQARNTDVVIMADGPDSPIENVTFEGVEICGQRLVPGDPRIKTNEWVRNVVVK